MSKGKKLYFAYGSNLNCRQMRRRCPGAVPVCALELPDYRLVFRGVADIVPCAGESVQGAVYEITRADEAALDRYEGFRKEEPLMGMYRKECFVAKQGGKVVEIMFYAMNRGGLSEPSAGYFGAILEGYEDWKLDPASLYVAAAEAVGEVPSWE